MKSIMNLAFLLLFSIVTLGLQINVEAKSVKKKTVSTKVTNNTKPKAKLETSMKFDATTLRGKHLSAFGTTATVENDKYLEDLLAGRKDFKDRMQDDQNRN